MAWAIHGSAPSFSKCSTASAPVSPEICSKVVDLRFLERRGVPSLRAIEWKCRRSSVGGKATPMQRIHHEQSAREQLVLDLDVIARQGARKMLAQALEAEVRAYLEATKSERDENGLALVVRNGYARSREVVCGAGSIEVKAPRVNDRRVDERTGQRMKFRSAILPP